MCHYDANSEQLILVLPVFSSAYLGAYFLITSTTIFVWGNIIIQTSAMNY